MRNVDFSPLHRFAIGFDRMQRQLDAAAQRMDEATSYPPYNIEVTGEDDYRITMAVAGFSLDDLEVEVEDGTLSIRGSRPDDEEGKQYLYHGIAGRSFERRFQLAEHIKVVGASLVDGLLHIDLQREVPEEKKPRTIAIQSEAGDRPKAVEHKTDNAKGSKKDDKKAA